MFQQIIVLLALASSQDSAPSYLEQESVPATKWHLTSRPWQAIGGNYLDIVEGTTRFLAGRLQANGRMPAPDPKDEEGLQASSTPDLPGTGVGNFSYQVGILYKAGRSTDLLSAGILAMDYDTEMFKKYVVGMNIPANGGLIRLFNEGLVFAFDALNSIPAVPQAKKDLWRSRLFVSDTVRRWIFNLRASPNSHCIRMQAEWNRLRVGLVTDTSAVINALEATWKAPPSTNWGDGQRNNIVPTRWDLYLDRLTDPDSLSTEAAGRVLLLQVTHQGYSGPSAAEMRSAVERGTHTMLLLQDPTGQTPPNGRTDNHNWVDAGNAAGMEVMAERLNAQGNSWRAGQFRRSAMLTMNSLRRFRRSDGTIAITKNQWPAEMEVGHQGAIHSAYISGVGHYGAKAYEARKSAIPEQPAPAEIGGYALTLDAKQGASVANAGGMMMQVNNRGEVTNNRSQYPTYDCHTPLGVVRFGRVGWDTRLGPGDGVQNFDRTRGISFAPTLNEGGAWIRLADIPGRYKGAFSVQFAHPLLVRCVVNYTGNGPAFRNEFVITPDGIVSITTGSGTWGMTVPLLTFDGKTSLNDSVGGRIARTSFPGGGDEQCFIALNSSASLVNDGGTMRSAYGDLQPVRVTTTAADNRIFVYPRNGGDPTAEAVRDSFRYTSSSDFSSVLGRVEGNLYIGRTSAGGVGSSIDLNDDGVPDVTFNISCGFTLQLKNGVVTAVETDRAVTATVQGRTYNLSAYSPVTVSGSNQLPTVSLTGPANGATFTAPASIALMANASDPDGSVSKVEFYNGTTLLGSDSSVGYGFTWTNVPAGSYPLTAKAYDNLGVTRTSPAVTVTVLSSSTGGSGTGLQGNYYDGLNFNSLQKTQVDPRIDITFSSPAPADMTVRWTGLVEPRFSESYTFYTTSDDGARLWVNGVLLIDNWVDHSFVEDRGVITLTAGQRYDIRMDYFKSGYGGKVQLLWSSPSQAKEIIPQSRLYPVVPAAAGLKGQYFDNIDFTNLKVTRTDASVNFDWGTGAPASGVGAGTFSVRWTGQLKAPTTGSYTFATVSDNGVRLWVNGQLLINNWTEHPVTENSGTISLTGGQSVSVKMEFYENGGGAVAKLLWSGPGISKQVIPSSRLSPAP